MVKVKTFASPLRVFHVKEQLENLDKMVNHFIAENGNCFCDLESTGSVET